jgi:hypothetical protein
MRELGSLPNIDPDLTVRPACVAPALLASVLAACALPVRQDTLPQPLEPASGSAFVLTADATCRINTGYSRTLRGGTHWRLYGTIAPGEVYRSSEQTLTVEGFNIAEAFPVVRDGTLVGFYLPVEKTFTPVTTPVPLHKTDVQGD